MLIIYHEPLYFDGSIFGEQVTPSYDVRSSVYAMAEYQDVNLNELIMALRQLPEMNRLRFDLKEFQRNRNQIIQFLCDNFKFRNILNSYFVRGVKAFTLNDPIENLPDDHVVTYKRGGRIYEMTIREIKEWQNSYRVFTPKEMPLGPEELQRFLLGKSEAGEEAAKMKFVVRISHTPILTDSNFNHVERGIGEKVGEIFLVSQCGVNFLVRHHDQDDIKKYVRNWQDVLLLDNGKFRFWNNIRERIEIPYESTQLAFKTDSRGWGIQANLVKRFSSKISKRWLFFDWRRRIS